MLHVDSDKLFLTPFAWCSLAVLQIRNGLVSIFKLQDATAVVKIKACSIWVHMVRPGKSGGGASLRKNSPLPCMFDQPNILRNSWNTTQSFNRLKKRETKKHVSWIAACTWDNYVWIWELKNPTHTHTHIHLGRIGVQNGKGKLENWTKYISNWHMCLRYWKHAWMWEPIPSNSYMVSNLEVGNAIRKLDDCGKCKLNYHKCLRYTRDTGICCICCMPVWCFSLVFSRKIHSFWKSAQDMPKRRITQGKT